MPMKQQHLAFVDLETTGLNPFLHEIFEIGIVLAEQRRNASGQLELQKISEHEFLLLPQYPEYADPIGLEISRYHDRDWTKALNQKKGIALAATLLQNCIFVAQNVSFDWAFLQKAGNDYGISFENVVHYHKLDLASMVFAKFYHEPKLHKYSLREMCEFFGVTNTAAHTALADARAAFEIAQIVLAA